MAGALDYLTVPAPNGAQYLSAGADLAKILGGLTGGLGDAYQSGQDFRYKQRQQNLFQDPDNQAALQKALQTGDYNDLAQRVVRSGGVQAIPHIVPLLDQQAQSRFFDALRNVGGGGAQPSTAPNYSTTAQGPDTLQRGSERIGTGQPSLSATGSDSAGAETIRSLTAGIANGVDVPQQKMAAFARALGVQDPDAPLSAQQEQLARRLIGTNVRGGSSQSAPPMTNDAASGQQGQQNPVVAGEGGSPISPVPSRGGGGIAPSGPRADGDQFSSRFNPNNGEPSTSRATPIGDARAADRADEMAQRYFTLAAAPRIGAAQSASAKATGEMYANKAKEIRSQLGTYNAPATNPQIHGQLSQFSKIGEAQGKVIGDYIDAGRSAYKRIQYLDTVGDALARGHGNITTGPFADFVLSSKQAVSSLLGVNLEGVGEAEVAKKTGFALATQAVKEITSRPTQMEVGQALQNNPGLLLSERGSALMVDVLKQSARQDAELSKLAGRPKNWANWQDVVDDFYAKHPLTSPFDHRKPLGMDDLRAIQGGGASAGSPAGGGAAGGWTIRKVQ